jgi:hypothetical protein
VLLDARAWICGWANVTVSTMNTSMEASLGDRVFDLVSVQHPALLRTPSNTAEHALLAPWRPLDTCSWCITCSTIAESHRPRRAASTRPTTSGRADVAHALDDDWTVEFEAGRSRNVSAGAPQTTTSFCMSSVACENGYHAELDASKSSLKR